MGEDRTGSGCDPKCLHRGSSRAARSLFFQNPPFFNPGPSPDVWYIIFIALKIEGAGLYSVFSSNDANKAS